MGPCTVCRAPAPPLPEVGWNCAWSTPRSLRANYILTLLPVRETEARRHKGSPSGSGVVQEMTPLGSLLSWEPGSGNPAPPGPDGCAHVYLDHFWVSFCLSCQQVLGFLKPSALVFVDHCRQGGQEKGWMLRWAGTHGTQAPAPRPPTAAHLAPGPHSSTRHRTAATEILHCLPHLA